MAVTTGRRRYDHGCHFVLVQRNIESDRVAAATASAKCDPAVPSPACPALPVVFAPTETAGTTRSIPLHRLRLKKVSNTELLRNLDSSYFLDEESRKSRKALPFLRRLEN